MLAIRQKLADANPNAAEFQFELSRVHMVMGTAFERAGKLAEALAAFERTVAILQKLADANPDVTQWQSELAVGLGFVGGIHLKAGRTALAAASLKAGRRDLEAAIIANTWGTLQLGLCLRLARRPWFQARIGDDGSRGAGGARSGDGIAPPSRRRRIPEALGLTDRP